MRKFLLLLLSTTVIVVNVCADTFTSVQTGNWTEGATWDKGSVPTSSDDVIIDGHTVTVNTTQYCEDLTINEGGVLVIQSSADFSCSQHVYIEGVFTMTGGIFNSGNAKSDTFHNHGGTFNFSGGTLNVAGRFWQNLTASVSNLSGSGIINVSTVGQQTASYNNFNVGNGGFNITESSILKIVLKNGNSTGAAVIKYTPPTSNFNGGSIVIENGTDLLDVYIDSDMPIYKIESKVGAGKTLHFNSNCDFELTDLAITSGNVQVDVGAQIDITGTATLNNALIVQSTSLGNGSLIPSGTVTGTATVERCFAAYTGSANGWHVIGSPVNNMTISGSNFDPTSTNNDLFAWDEDDYLWRNYLGGDFPGTTFQNGIGYMVAYESEVTNDFVGTLNNSDVTFNNLSKTTGKGEGWHLLSNPFASAVKWKDGNWAMLNVNGVAKVYNETAGNYSDIAANGIIPSTNGFFVQVSSSANSITIPAASRVHDAEPNYKNGNEEEMNEILKLLVNNDANGFSDRTTIGFCEDAETSFDWVYDSHKLFGQSTAPQLWTVIEGEEYSTNNLPHIYENFSLPLHFRAGVNSVHHLVIEGLESFYLNSEIYLEDIFLNEIIDLREQQMYDFTATVDDDEDRFILHFYGVTSSDDKHDLNNTNVYANMNTIYIQSNQLPKTSYLIEVFNVMGQIVMLTKLEPSTLTGITLSEKVGIYIVRIHTESGIVVQKVLIN